MGLYLNPPEAAVVFAVDEKPQIQALNRTAPILPMLPTTPEGATHDYIRHGTLDLFAALNMATGTVITQLRDNHSGEQFIKFLNKINREVPDDLDMHIVLDNAPTTKKLQRSAHRSVTELAAGIHDWIDVWNDDPKPFMWTTTADEILESIARYCGAVLEATGATDK